MLTILDWDGVVVNSFEQMFELFCSAQQHLGMGRPFVRDDLRYVPSLTLYALAHRIGIGEEFFDDFLEIFLDLQKKISSMAPFFPGIIKIIKKISQKSAVAIISNNSQWEIDRYLDQAGIENLFCTIHVGTDKRSKSEKILQAMADLEEKEKDTFMVGDSRSDIYEGKKAGVKTIAATWGYQPRETLELEKPDFIAGTPREFIRIVNSLGLT